MKDYSRSWGSWFWLLFLLLFSLLNTSLSAWRATAAVAGCSVARTSLKVASAMCARSITTGWLTVYVRGGG